MSDAITVVAAVIERDGRVLICQRRRGDRFELKWEFPGGKVKAGETLEEALQRELWEELGVGARIGAEMHRTRHRYPEMERDVELVFFSATVEGEQCANLAFERIVWAERAEMAGYDFLAADRELVGRLAGRGSGEANFDTR
jgi:8-oxo-dGTP diphosphatase